ncbi:MAG: ATP synthase F1 subunit delta [Actinomycetota bacterium]|nr:ATP synthase F1 subunit delta [Actinomycetota bacterium]
MTVEASIRGYARALFEIARSEGALARVADELFRLARTLEREQGLRQTLTDIQIPLSAKEKLVDDLLAGKASPHTINAVRFIISQGHARDLVEIADELARTAEQEANRELGEVRTAVELDDEQKARLEKALSKATGRSVAVKVIVDPSVQGGVLARVGDVVIDGTVRHKLDLLKQHLGVQ